MIKRDDNKESGNENFLENIAIEDVGFPVNRNEMRLKKVAQSAEYASITADSNIIELGRELGANNDSITGSTTTTGSNILITCEEDDENKVKSMEYGKSNLVHISLFVR